MVPGRELSTGERYVEYILDENPDVLEMIRPITHATMVDAQGIPVPLYDALPPHFPRVIDVGRPSAPGFLPRDIARHVNANPDGFKDQEEYDLNANPGELPLHRQYRARRESGVEDRPPNRTPLRSVWTRPNPIGINFRDGPVNYQTPGGVNVLVHRFPYLPQSEEHMLQQSPDANVVNNLHQIDTAMQTQPWPPQLTLPGNVWEVGVDPFGTSVDP